MSRSGGRIAFAMALAWGAAPIASAGVAVWTTNGPAGGAELVAADPLHPGFVYSDTARSTDGGLTWQRNGLTAYHVHALAVGPTGTVFAAGFKIGTGPDVLLRSRDGGATWSEVYAPGYTLGPIFVDPGDPSSVLLSRSLFSGFSHLERRGYLSRSSNEGDQFDDVTLPSRGLISAMASDRGNSDALLVSAERDSEEVGNFVDWRSLDEGVTWIQFTDVPFSSIVFDAHHPGIVYFAGVYGLFQSTDAGATVTSVNTNLSSPRILIVSPARPDVLYALADGGVYQSSNRGLTWKSLNVGLPDASAIRGLAIDATGMSLYAATPSGIYQYQLSDTVLTLNAPHLFTVTLSATDQRTGHTGAGVATPVNDLWGYFSIPAITGNPSNPEVFVKILDGTAINGRYWFFYGGLTDLEYTLTVTENATGLQRTYTKPAGSECGGSDTAAFAP
jgi:hypothetical protein